MQLITMNCFEFLYCHFALKPHFVIPIANYLLLLLPVRERALLISCNSQVAYYIRTTCPMIPCPFAYTTCYIQLLLVSLVVPVCPCTVPAKSMHMKVLHRFPGRQWSHSVGRNQWNRVFDDRLSRLINNLST